MTAFLLDINVLIALIDPAHVQHDRAHAWFAATGSEVWATCPLTENGVLRIVGHARYPNSPGTPAAVAEVVAGLRALAGHEFWPDDLTLFDGRHVDTARLLDSAQVTDVEVSAEELDRDPDEAKPAEASAATPSGEETATQVEGTPEAAAPDAGGAETTAT